MGASVAPGPAAGEHLVEHGAESELIRARLRRRAGRLLGGHVTDAPDQDARLREAGPRGGLRRAGSLGRHRDLLGESEVKDLGEAVAPHHHVLGLQVAVDDSCLVRRREALGDLDADRENARERKRRRSCEHLAQRLALDPLHREERAAAALADVVDRDDVRVVEGRRRSRLVLEAGETLAVGRQRLRENLDGDEPAEARVPRLVDLPHATGADGRQDLVRPETRAGRKHLPDERIAGRRRRPAPPKRVSRATSCRPARSARVRPPSPAPRSPVSSRGPRIR